jgi:hypothetical protein
MSNKTYQMVTIEEMKEVLKAEKGWVRTTEPRSCEYFFEFPLSNSPHIVIKVASSITANGISRGVGKDAIRVFAVDTQKQKGYISTKRVYRIGTWRDNLRKAVTAVYESAKARRDGR